MSIQTSTRQRWAGALFGGIALLAVTLTAFAADDLLLEWRRQGAPQLPSYISDWAIVKALPGNSYLLRPPAGLSAETWQRLLQRLQADPAIRHASPNSRLQLLADGFAGHAAQGWHLDDIGRDNKPLDSAVAPQIIAVIDSGLPPQALRAEAFRSDLLLPGYDFINEDDDPSDRYQPQKCNGQEPSNWHGTAVISIISSLAKRGYLGGITGTTEENPYTPVQIMPLRVLGPCGGYSDDISAAIDWTVQTENRGPADIINMSLGRKGFCPFVIQHSINKAIHKNSLVVVAAGNEFIPATINSPNNCVGVLSVTGHNHKGAFFDSQPFDPTAFSYGRGSHVSAPGFSIHALSVNSLSSRLSDDNFYGTSLAAPIVSATAALIRNRFSQIALAPLSAALSFRPQEQDSPPQINLQKSIEQLQQNAIMPDPEIAFIQRYYSTNILQIMPFLARRANPLFKTATRLSADTLYDSRSENGKTLTASAAAAFEISDLPPLAENPITVRINSNHRPLLACLYHANGEALQCCSNKAGSNKLIRTEETAYRNTLNCDDQGSIRFQRAITTDHQNWDLARQDSMQWPDELGEDFSYYLVLEAIRERPDQPTPPIDYSLQYVLHEAALPTDGFAGRFPRESGGTSKRLFGGVGSSTWLVAGLCWPWLRRRRVRRN